jgi:hypothetical protein
MRIRLLPSLALATVAIPFAVACGGTEDPPPATGGTGGTGGATGGTAGTTGGTAGAATGGTAGTTGGAAGTGGVAGSAAGSGGAAGSAAGSGGAAGSAAGSAGAAGSSAGSGGGASDSPSDTSQAGLEAFFTAMSHRGTDWRANGAMAVEGAMPHVLNQIWYNKTLRQSAADGKGSTAMPHTTGAMVVKELYTGANVVGYGAMLRTATAWIYYCKASEPGRCSSASMPNQATYATSAGSCACHGAGTIVTGDMIPAP